MNPDLVFWRKYPMKPMRVDETIFDRIALDNYTMEPKFDGWRAMILVGESVSLWTREYNRIDMPENLAEQFRSLNLPQGTVLDGEIWNPNKRGSWSHNPGIACKLTIWDVLQASGKSVEKKGFVERRQILEDLIPERSDDIELTRIYPADKTMYDSIRQEAELHREREKNRSGFIHGVVLKKKNSPRREHPNRSVEHPDWLKLVLWSQN